MFHKNADLTQKCIWVTGATSGIGQALASELCDMGNFVIVSGRREAKLQQMALAANGKMSALPMDLTADETHLRDVRNKLNDMTDYLDAVICCAGVCEYEDDLAFDPKLYQRVFDVNVLGVVKTLNIAMPLLRAANRRVQIAAIGSLSSTVAFPRAEAYGASKAALEYLIKALRADTVNLPVDVTLVRPGFVATDLTAGNDFEMPFMMQPADAAKRIIRGLSKRKSVLDFPLRLSLPLRLAGCCDGLWWRWVAPRMTRQSRRDWRRDRVPHS